jgi:hypothetical protein
MMSFCTNCNSVATSTLPLSIRNMNHKRMASVDGRRNTFTAVCPPSGEAHHIPVHGGTLLVAAPDPKPDDDLIKAETCS